MFSSCGIRYAFQLHMYKVKVVFSVSYLIRLNFIVCAIQIFTRIFTGYRFFKRLMQIKKKILASLFSNKLRFIPESLSIHTRITIDLQSTHSIHSLSTHLNLFLNHFRLILDSLATFCRMTKDSRSSQHLLRIIF